MKGIGCNQLINSLSATMLSRVRGLFYIALGNFIFPIAMSTTETILILTDHSPLTGADVEMANSYITIIGVVFATIWTMGQARAACMAGDEGSTWNEPEPKISWPARTAAKHTERVADVDFLSHPAASSTAPRGQSPRLSALTSSAPDVDAGGGQMHRVPS